MSAYVDQHRDRFGVEPICATLDVSASAYYHPAGASSARVLEDERLLGVIRETEAYDPFGVVSDIRILRLTTHQIH